MAAAAMNDDTRHAHSRNPNSIASLLGPASAANPGGAADGERANLLSLSRLAAEMEPVSPAGANANASANPAFTRSRSVPHNARSAASRDSLRLGVSSAGGGGGGVGTKRMSRTKSTFANMRRAVASAASAMASTATSSSDSASVLRQIQPPNANSSKATSTTNSLESGGGAGHIGPPHAAHAAGSGALPKTEAAAAMLTALPRLHASRLRLEQSNVFQAAAARLTESHGAAGARQHATPAGATSHPAVVHMDVDDTSGRTAARPASAAAGAGGSHPRTTPDAKRAQNRESAKRFRVAQKKRWADLQDLVAAKDKEIARLTEMLQKVTDARIPVKVAGRAPAPLDSLVMAELDLFVKLVTSPGPRNEAAGRTRLLAAPASSIGSLHRVLLATTDGSITGVRHLCTAVGNIAGGQVGQYLWDEVHENDSLQLRFTVLHAERFASDMAREALVFAYRRGVLRCSTEGDSSQATGGATGSHGGGSCADDKDGIYVRLKGCVHPVLTETGEVSHLMLAEFVET